MEIQSTCDTPLESIVRKRSDDLNKGYRVAVQKFYGITDRFHYAVFNENPRDKRKLREFFDNVKYYLVGVIGTTPKESYFKIEEDLIPSHVFDQRTVEGIDILLKLYKREYGGYSLNPDSIPYEIEKSFINEASEIFNKEEKMRLDNLISGFKQKSIEIEKFLSDFGFFLDMYHTTFRMVEEGFGFEAIRDRFVGNPKTSETAKISFKDGETTQVYLRNLETQYAELAKRKRTIQDSFKPTYDGLRKAILNFADSLAPQFEISKTEADGLYEIKVSVKNPSTIDSASTIITLVPGTVYLHRFYEDKSTVPETTTKLDGEGIIAIRATPAYVKFIADKEFLRSEKEHPYVSIKSIAKYLTPAAYECKHYLMFDIFSLAPRRISQ